MKYALILVCICLMVFTIAGCGDEQALTYDQAIEKLNAYVSSGVTGKAVVHQADSSWVGESDSIEELPPIDKYPLSVVGNGQIDIELFSSTEKSSASSDNWMEVQAKKFNAQNLRVSCGAR
jgi:Ca-activated chloride channel family protein